MGNVVQLAQLAVGQRRRSMGNSCRAASPWRAGPARVACGWVLSSLNSEMGNEAAVVDPVVFGALTIDGAPTTYPRRMARMAKTWK